MDGRVMVCDRCGFKANKDETPLTWYIRDARELRATSDEGLGKKAI